MWDPVSAELKAADALVVVSPEWGGMATPGVKNFLLNCTADEIGHKPALIVTVSASRGGSYPVAELRMSGYKNNRVAWLPEHVIVQHAGSNLNAPDGAADLAFVGGSLVAAGGHSLLEPAALGVPTLTGPHQESAPQIAAQLVAAGGARIVADGPALGAAVRELLADEAARGAMGAAALAVVSANRGALAGILALVKRRLEPEPELAPPPAERR